MTVDSSSSGLFLVCVIGARPARLTPTPGELCQEEGSLSSDSKEEV